MHPSISLTDEEIDGMTVKALQGHLKALGRPCRGLLKSELQEQLQNAVRSGRALPFAGQDMHRDDPWVDTQRQQRDFDQSRVGVKGRPKGPHWLLKLGVSLVALTALVMIYSVVASGAPERWPFGLEFHSDAPPRKPIPFDLQSLADHYPSFGRSIHSVLNAVFTHRDEGGTTPLILLVAAPHSALPTSQVTRSELATRRFIRGLAAWLTHGLNLPFQPVFIDTKLAPELDSAVAFQNTVLPPNGPRVLVVRPSLDTLPLFRVGVPFHDFQDATEPGTVLIVTVNWPHVSSADADDGEAVKKAVRALLLDYWTRGIVDGDTMDASAREDMAPALGTRLVQNVLFATS
jgi:hypothetical protein